jgi:hypothetical protein
MIELQVKAGVPRDVARASIKLRWAMTDDAEVGTPPPGLKDWALRESGQCEPA